MLVSTAELATALKLPSTTPGLSEALQSAQAVVAAHLGAQTLAAASRSERVTPPRFRQTLSLRLGPLTQVTSVTVDGEALNTSDVQADFWAIGYEPGFRAGRTVVVEYEAGWDGADSTGESSLPDKLRAALIMVAANAMNKGADAGGGKTSESIGDYSVGYAASSVTSITGVALIPSDAALLLQEFKRPQL